MLGQFVEERFGFLRGRLHCLLGHPYETIGHRFVALGETKYVPAETQPKTRLVIKDGEAQEGSPQRDHFDPLSESTPKKCDVVPDRAEIIPMKILPELPPDIVYVKQDGELPLLIRFAMTNPPLACLIETPFLAFSPSETENQ